MLQFYFTLFYERLFTLNCIFHVCYVSELHYSFVYLRTYLQSTGYLRFTTILDIIFLYHVFYASYQVPVYLR